MVNTHNFSKGEEIANAITHGVGALLSIVALVVLIVFSYLYGNVWHIVSFTLFGSTMVLLYISSTLVHSFPQGKAKYVFEIFDHSSIYFFIAGSYTPFLLVIVKGWVGWTILVIIWGLSIGGTVFKSFFVRKYLFTSTFIYLLMGWSILFIWKPVTQLLSYNGLVLLVMGGIFYTVGAIFYVWRGFKYHHMVWHIFVLGGTICHFFCILFFVLSIS